MIGFLIRRFRWMLLGAGVRYLTRRGVSRSVDDAATALEERLPDSLVKAANVLPGDAVRAGAAATVAARAAKRTGYTVQRTGSTAARIVPRRLPRPSREMAVRIADARAKVREESEIVRREMTSDFARYVDGDGAALEALLDRRDAVIEPIAEVPAAIARGRRRFRRPLPAAEVARAQRTYRQTKKPWDRPSSGR